ncbi:hypothetical protein SAMN04488085_10281 [Geodermatophilus ruber]|uniref:Uncharacterized protein n=1 Tax=Geodermatophilus ruber TaxID=504800 RepID=A0A1I4A582_9ACTN|nr:hypothetical protein SAMN04488085_10281 [Geodermatophilus ruber]
MLADHVRDDAERDAEGDDLSERQDALSRFVTVERDFEPYHRDAVNGTVTITATR